MLSLLASLWYRAERSLDVKIGEQPSSGENTRGLHSAESDSQKTYVGNLSFQTTETDLSDMFGEIGQVGHRVGGIDGLGESVAAVKTEPACEALLDL